MIKFVNKFSFVMHTSTLAHKNDVEWQEAENSPFNVTVWVVLEGK